MDTQNLELLMERLITVNEEVLSQLTEIKLELSELKEELNWVGEHSYGKIVYDGLNEITSKLDSIDFNTSNI